MQAESSDAALTDLTRSDGLSALLGERAVNLRQMISRAHRGMNLSIVENFDKRGYTAIRPLHLSLLANMNLGETHILDLIDRTQITSSGVEDLVTDLVRLGYLSIIERGEPAGCKASFTDAGWELMLVGFNIQKEIEADFRERLTPGDIDKFRSILGALFIKEI